MPSISKFISKIGLRERRSRRSTQESPSTAPAPALDRHPQGLGVVSEGTNPVVESVSYHPMIIRCVLSNHPLHSIVVIHGLDGHREKTWTAKNGVHWLRDLLRVDIPEARILAWGYDANTHAISGTCCSFLYDHARTLVSDLNRRRKLTDVRGHTIMVRRNTDMRVVLRTANHLYCT